MQTVSLQDFVLAVAENLRELRMGTTTATAAVGNQLVDSDLINNRNRFWVDSEILLLEPLASIAGAAPQSKPFLVRDFDGNTGTLTLDREFAPGVGVPQGLEYALWRPQGRGAPYRAYRQALKQALDYYGSYTDLVDDSLTTSAGTYEYTIPYPMTSLYLVELLDSEGYGHKLTAGIHYNLWPNRQLVLHRGLPVEGNYGLRISGVLGAYVPPDWTDTIRIDYDDVLEYTVELLQRGSPRQIDAARSGNQQQERLRFRKRIPYPNEQEII